MIPENDADLATTAEFMPLTNSQQITTTTIFAGNRDRMEHNEEEECDSFMNSDKQNSTATATTTTTAKDASTKKSRLDSKLKLNDIIDLGKNTKTSFSRQKRNANYGTIQEIDEKSLDELRKTYKESLKEITLQPDEDPMEALMRYNEASIREALEQANHEPFEIHANDMPTNEEAYYNGEQVATLERPQDLPSIITTPIGHPKQHGYYKTNIEQQQIQSNLDYRNLQAQRKEIAVQSTNKEINETLSIVKLFNNTKISQNLKTALIDATQTKILNLNETELQIVLDLIKKEMQICCDVCRERILASIKTNIKQINTLEDMKTHLDKTTSIDDEQFRNWLLEMESKGYDIKYLKKSHYWEYLNSGKLTIDLESNEDVNEEPNDTNTIVKKSNENKSLKRYTKMNSFSNEHNEYENKNYLDISRRTKGIAFKTENMPNLNEPRKDYAYVVNEELCHLTKEQPTQSASTLSPYALRGKFKRLHKKRPITTKTSIASMPNNSKNNAQTKSDKVFELINLIYDLDTEVHQKNDDNDDKSTKLSVMVMPIKATTTTATTSIAWPMDVAAATKTTTTTKSSSSTTTATITANNSTIVGSTNKPRLKRRRKNKSDNVTPPLFVDQATLNIK